MSKLTRKAEGLSCEFIRIGQGETDWERIEDGLRKLNIIGATDQLSKFVDGESWHRGGGETYVADAVVEVCNSESHQRHVIAKALVSMGMPPERRLEVWLKRRRIVSELGIPVSKLFCAREGTLFEEFIDRPLTSTDLEERLVLEQVGQIGARLDLAGFRTLSFISDLRRSKDRLYYIDFGSDLGDPSKEIVDSAATAIRKFVTSSHLGFCLDCYYAELEKHRGHITGHMG